MAKAPEDETVSSNEAKGLPEIPPEELERWLDKARDLETPPTSEEWGLGILDWVVEMVKQWHRDQREVSKLGMRENLLMMKRFHESTRGPDSPASEQEKSIGEQLRDWPDLSEEKLQEYKRRGRAVVRAFGEVEGFLQEQSEQGTTENYVIPYLRMVMENVRSPVVGTVCSAEAGMPVSTLRWRKPRKLIPITNKTALNISWVLTTTTHAVVFEAGIDGIKLGVDGVDIGAILKVTKTDGAGEVLTQKGSVAAHGTMDISVTHREDHFITIFSQKGMHCENMPTKVKKSIVVKDDVYVREFLVTPEGSGDSWWWSMWPWSRS